QRRADGPARGRVAQVTEGRRAAAIAERLIVGGDGETLAVGAESKRRNTPRHAKRNAPGPTRGGVHQAHHPSVVADEGGPPGGAVGRPPGPSPPSRLPGTPKHGARRSTGHLPEKGAPDP